ncbi:hypothetical protein HDF19_06295 [Mucilaginibacter sp. E4BP6]|jgi:hypothetical protein|uniref:hypothetical protein n=1 Tax=Mucilaginibacter sp. E4BP6 TaxID=2723089 RepID=UPI0015C6EE26|nr:hypothetical protein [Mucilaginibacter sp. E4BP6]NYE68352.1 hypothetical protein [Mucilaginibacter sp. E4BP6]
MTKKPLPVLIALLFIFSGCGMFESVVKSTFPYTTNLTIPASSESGKQYTAVNMATSYDQNFTKDGNNANHIGQVMVVSAKLRSTEPAGFNIGNLEYVKFYMSKHDGSDEILVASRTDITKGVGNTMVLDIDNSNFLDQLVRQPDVRIRMVYKLRNNIDTDVTVKLLLGLSAYPKD